ncbi:MAG: porin family protein [Bacteroidota bacterium]
MKLRTIITLALVSLTLTITAQKEKLFEVGLQGGFGSTWILNQNNYGLQEMDYDYHYGGGFNFQAGYNFDNSMGLFTEIGFLKQGQKYKDTWTGDADVKRTINSKYLNIPIFFKYSAGETRARFRLLAGPQFCFLQKAEQTYTINGYDLEGMFELEDKEGNKFDPGAKDIKERFNSMDVSLVLDLGVDVFVVDNMLYLSVGARAYYGLTDINASAYQLENWDGNYESSHNAGGTIYFGVHYLIAGK